MQFRSISEVDDVRKLLEWWICSVLSTYLKINMEYVYRVPEVMIITKSGSLFHGLRPQVRRQSCSEAHLWTAH